MAFGGADQSPLIAQQQTMSELVRALLDAPTLASLDWAAATLTVLAVGGDVERGPLVVLGRDGSETDDTSDVADLGRLVDDVRGAYYTEGAGTWYRLDLTVTRDPDGTVGASADVGYDEEPGFRTAEPADFAIDQQRYPRAPENTPAWVQEQLDRAPELAPRPPSTSQDDGGGGSFWRRFRRP